MASQVLEYTVGINGFDCGYGGSLRPLALINILQEAAARHADRLGFGAVAMGGENRTWMLSRLDLRMDSPPGEGQECLVRTWPSGFHKLFAVRDFQLLDPRDRRVLLRASWAYLVIDLAARRPLRAHNIFGPDMLSPEGTCLPEASFSLPEAAPEAAWQPAFSQTARDRHLDHNGHVNSAHLIAWLCDAALDAGSALAELRVEFSQEVLHGETLLAERLALPAAEGQTASLSRLRRGDTVCATAEIVLSRQRFYNRNNKSS